MCQSTRTICRKPGLNHDDSRWRKSQSTASSSRCSRFSSSRRSRMRRIVAVPPGARFSRRSSSWRGGSAATLSCARLAADGSAAYAFDAASTCMRIGRELGEQRREESRLLLVVQFPVQIQRDLGQRHAGRLAALGQQLPAAGDEAPDLESVARDGRGALLNGFEHAWRSVAGDEQRHFKYRGPVPGGPACRRLPWTDSRSSCRRCR